MQEFHQAELDRLKSLNKSPSRVLSTLILEKLKSERFLALFRTLDSDRDGRISCLAIDISLLSPELLEIMTPLFCELEELGKNTEDATLDLEEFSDAVGRLYDQVQNREKHVILDECAKLEQIEEGTARE